MPYIPNKPLSTETLADSQPVINSNFTLADTYFGVDHQAFSAATRNGEHNKISFIGVSPAGVVPTTTEGITLIAELEPTRNKYILHQKQNSAAGGGSDASYQLTNTAVPLSASDGYSYLPGGILMQWGFATLTGDLTAIKFSLIGLLDYDAAPYSISLVGTRSNSGTYDICLNTGSLTSTGFTIRRASSSSITKVYWMCIGPRA